MKAFLGAITDPKFRWALRDREEALEEKQAYEWADVSPLPTVRESGTRCEDDFFTLLTDPDFQDFIDVLDHAFNLSLIGRQ